MAPRWLRAAVFRGPLDFLAVFDPDLTPEMNYLILSPPPKHLDRFIYCKDIINILINEQYIIHTIYSIHIYIYI